MDSPPRPLSPRRLLLAAVLSAAVLASAFGALMPGMFGDGLQHALIARNAADDRAGLWVLRDVGPFYDHLPLGLWVQGLAFRVFGDGPFVERFWSLACFHAAALGAGVLLRPLGVRLWTFVLLLWAVPHSVWLARANMLEPGVALLAVAAVALLAPLPAGASRGRASLGGGLVALSVLWKGPAGLFPLATPLIGVFAEPGPAQLRRAPAPTAWALFGFALTFGAALALPGAGAYLEHYAREQLLPALGGVRDPAPSRAFLVVAFLQDIAPLLAVAVLLALGGRGSSPKEAEPKVPAPGRSLRLLLLLALCATLPLLLSAKQARWYLFPGFVLAAAAGSVALQGAAARIEARVAASAGIRGALSMVVLASLCALPFAANVAVEDRPLQSDVRAAGVPPGGRVQACDAGLAADRGLGFALARVHRARLSPGEPGRSGVWVGPAGEGCRRAGLPCVARGPEPRRVRFWACGPAD